MQNRPFIFLEFHSPNQITPDEATGGHLASSGVLIWLHLAGSGFIWPYLASSGFIWFGGLDFQKNEMTILQLISLCETFDLEPFWDLG